jgi:hypothetical protein
LIESKKSDNKNPKKVNTSFCVDFKKNAVILEMLRKYFKFEEKDHYNILLTSIDGKHFL